MKVYEIVESKSKGSIEDCIRKTLKKEGGAAGLGAIKKACKDAGHKEDAQKVMSKMKDVKQHIEGDYILETTSSCAIATSMGGGNGFANGGPGVVSREAAAAALSFCNCFCAARFASIFCAMSSSR